MLSRFWEKDFQKNLLQEKKKIIKKHKAEFVAFLEKKYGKEYYNKAVSERELIRDINEFEAYREEKNSTNVDKKIKKTPAKKTETANSQKHKLKPKRAPKRVWLLSDGKVNESPVFEEDDEEEYEDGFSFEQLSKKDKEIILRAWNESFNGRKTILLNPRKDDIKNIKILIELKKRYIHLLNNQLNKKKKKNLIFISEEEDSLKFLEKQLKEAIKKAAQKTKNKNLQKYKLKPKRGRKTGFWLV